MAARTRSMTEGNPYFLIFTFALPLMAGNIFQQLYTVVDTMIVGRALGVQALAALGSADWFNWMMLGAIQGLAQGFGVLMAQSFGAARYKELRQVTGNSIVLAAISAVLLLILGQLWARPVLELLQTPDTIIGGSLVYLRIIFAGIPVVMAYNLLACILRSLGDSKTPLLAMVVAAITNIILDLLFVMGFHWGIAGAAIATVTAQFISCIYCFIHIKKIDILAMSGEDFKLQSYRVKKLLYLATPMALQNILIGVGGMILQSVVNTYGVVFIAGFTATNKLYGVLEIAAISYGYAMITYMGQNLGANKITRIRQGMRASVVISVLTSIVIAAIMLIFGRTIVSLFISGTPEEVTAAVEVAYTFLKILSLFLPILYLVHIFRNAVEGLGNATMPMMSGVMEFIIRSGSCMILPAFIGESGVFWGEVLAWTGADIVLILGYFMALRKITKQIQ